MGGEHSFVTCLLSKWAQQQGHTVIGVPHELLFAITKIVTIIPSKILKCSVTIFTILIGTVCIHS